MMHSKVVVPWREGLHLRRAAKLVWIAERFRSTISLKRGGKIADVRSVLSVVALCATMGTTLYIEAIGEDEQDATQAVEQVFSSNENDGSSDGALKKKV